MASEGFAPQRTLLNHFDSDFKAIAVFTGAAMATHNNGSPIIDRIANERNEMSDKKLAFKLENKKNWRYGINNSFVRKNQTAAMITKMIIIFAVLA